MSGWPSVTRIALASPEGLDAVKPGAVVVASCKVTSGSLGPRLTECELSDDGPPARHAPAKVKRTTLPPPAEIALDGPGDTTQVARTTTTSST